jgi:hypothetical protein
MLATPKRKSRATRFGREDHENVLVSRVLARRMPSALRNFAGGCRKVPTRA